MSTRAVSWAIHDFTVDNPQYKLILILLAENANENGLCWPSQRTTADKAGCSVSTVKRVQKILEEHGVITVQRKSIGHQKTKNTYRLRIEKRFNLITKTKPPKCMVEGITQTPSNFGTSTDQEPCAFQEGQIFEGVTETPSNENSVEGVRESPSNPVEGITQTPSKVGRGHSYEPFKGVTAMTPEPSVNHNSNSNNADTASGVRLTPSTRFPMHSDWQPSEMSLDTLKTLHAIDDVFALTELPEFRMYWIGEGREFHQGAWDSKFMGHVRKRHTWEKRHKKTGETAEDTMARFTDRSWAEA